MDMQTAWEEISRPVYLDEVELLLGEDGPAGSETRHALAELALRTLADGCRIRAGFVQRLWQVMLERWNAGSASRPPAAPAVPARSELEEILQQAANDAPEVARFEDPVFLDAVERLLRQPPGHEELARAYGETILRLWDEQMIRRRFVERLRETANDRCRASGPESRGLARHCLPMRVELERMLDGTAFEWIEERRQRLFQPRDREVKTQKSKRKTDSAESGPSLPVLLPFAF